MKAKVPSRTTKKTNAASRPESTISRSNSLPTLAIVLSTPAP